MKENCQIKADSEVKQLSDTKTSSSTRYYPYVSNIKELFNKVVDYKKLVNNDFLFKVKDDCTVIGKIQ